MAYEDNVEYGFDHGLDRAGHDFDLEVTLEDVAETKGEFQDVVDVWPFDLSESFVSLVSEIVGVAAAARYSNDFPPLSRDQLISYVAHSADVLDSLKHA